MFEIYSFPFLSPFFPTFMLPLGAAIPMVGVGGENRTMKRKKGRRSYL